MNKPTTKNELLAHLRTFAKHGAASLEAMIRDFNTYVAEDVEPRAAARAAERKEYVAVRLPELEYDYWARLRNDWLTKAGAEYDASNPPIDVPERVELSVATEIAATAKKGKAA